jgi:hypothetical protein
MMHDECIVGIGGTPAHWYPADRDVPPDAILHPSVYERLALLSVRNYTSHNVNVSMALWSAGSTDSCTKPVMRWAMIA